MTLALVMAIIGAPCTGKTTLAIELQGTLATEGRSVALVSEPLRERRHLAELQSGRIAAAARHHDIVIADTTVLMTAVYSETAFGDTSLYAAAMQAHRGYALSLLTALDLPWPAQTSAPAREPVDALIRAALHRADLPYAVVTGRGPLRLASALQAVRHALRAPSLNDEAAANPRWRWVCERCSDPDCERHLFGPVSGSRLNLAPDPMAG